MKLSFKVKRVVQDEPQIIIEKITSYLKKFDYKVVERDEASLVFDENVYSDRTSSRSDYYTRVADGKFEIIVLDQETIVSLVYRVSILREFVFLLIIFIVAVTVDYKALMLSIVFVANFIYKINCLNRVLLDEIVNKNL
ncbi:hypothetical protein FBD94_14575 [Pedobacter hiemivivus]|uniref:Uncharacterized protein n=1 Tax=Pedobacter hiemivivus TaxID=2530454 RepID=A0A4U1G8Z8_9SPHI|nr:hypothetical protein [Pedobacter hiemivivus]TKC60138.1 hypothetical protein FBD94_14575 [Pedobacter hiemivivus]